MTQEAEDAVRGGRSHVILTDEQIGPERAAIPMILATGAVHSHLVRQQLRTFISLNVRSGECLDVHYFAVLIGVGATAVNAYLAQESIAERHQRGLIPNIGLEEAVRRYKAAIDQGLLKIMSKMGIAVISSYRGAYNFEAVGPVARARSRVLSRHDLAHLRSRPQRHPAEDAGGACGRL